MKVENASFDKQALIRVLRVEYALDIARLEFVPKGEESYGYLATTTTGRQYFVKVHLASSMPTLEACYRFVHSLCTHERREWVVSPVMTTAGKCLVTLDDHAVAIFEYISGASKAPHELTGTQQEQFARQLAQLHASSSTALPFELPQETFGVSFKDWLLDVLAAVDKPLQTNHPWAQMAYNLIRNEKPQILHLLASGEETGTRLRNSNLPLAVTHGDLASHNIIQDESGGLLIIDWGKLCLAPAARDLITLCEGGNEPLFATYFRQVDVVPSELSEALTFYRHYNLLAAITDYGSWLLLEEASPEDAENAWENLSKALPLNLQQVQTQVEAICAIAQHTSKVKKSNE